MTGRITFNTKVQPVSDKNLLVIEAIPELLGPKQQIFKDLRFVIVVRAIVFTKLLSP